MIGGSGVPELGFWALELEGQGGAREVVKGVGLDPFIKGMNTKSPQRDRLRLI